MLELAGRELDGRPDAHGELPARPVVAFRPAKADALIGVETAPERQYALLGRLGFDRDGDSVVVPTWRARDVTREVDAIEEIARFRLEDVPSTLPARREMFGRLTREQSLKRRVEDALVGLGFAETYTPTLRPDDDTTWKLPEPISVELTALRTTLIPSLVEAVAAQRRCGRAPHRAVRDRARLPARRRRAAGRAASASPASPRAASCRAKGVVEALYAALKAEPTFERDESPLLHPGKTARTQAGLVGELHPRLLEGTWGAFELDLGELFAPRASR